MNREEAVDLYKHIDVYNNTLMIDDDDYSGEVLVEYQVEENKYRVILMVHDDCYGPPTLNFFYNKEDWERRRDQPIYQHPHP